MASGSALLPLLNDEAVSNLLRKFDCPVCYQAMSTRIFQCTSGHSVCETCKPKLDKCPTCRKHMSDILNVRNFFAEDIIASVHEYILNSNVETSNPNLPKANTLACELKSRPSVCPLYSFVDCTENLEYADVLEHLRYTHKLRDKSALFGEMPLKFDYYAINRPDLQTFNILTSYGKEFLAFMLTDQRNVYFGLLLIGNETDDERYTGHITLQLNEKRVISWTFPISSTVKRALVKCDFDEFTCPGVYPRDYVKNTCSDKPSVVFKVEPPL